MTLNVNSIHTPFKRTVIFRLDRKARSICICKQEILNMKTDTAWLKVKGWTKIYHAKH